MPARGAHWAGPAHTPALGRLASAPPIASLSSSSSVHSGRPLAFPFAPGKGARSQAAVAESGSSGRAEGATPPQDSPSLEALRTRFSAGLYGAALPFLLAKHSCETTGLFWGPEVKPLTWQRFRSARHRDSSPSPLSGWPRQAALAPSWQGLPSACVHGGESRPVSCSHSALPVAARLAACQLSSDPGRRVAGGRVLSTSGVLSKSDG